MTDRNNRLYPQHPGDAPAAKHGFWHKVWQVFQVVQARLRFVAFFVVIGVVVGYWDTLSNYYEKWTRPLYGHQEAAASDTEFFCPMHPFIVREKPGEKCPICHMDLAKRKKGTGDEAPLAPGTVSRVQLSPYRVVLAGVQTSEVKYRNLSRTITRPRKRTSPPAKRPRSSSCSSITRAKWSRRARSSRSLTCATTRS